ncbi:transcription factor A, mitochondrial-like isoform X3 [Centruroides sculpturatus]|nr:transcription factor A, mitochondrial-like isoform X3 [Centruroides sculpturatus]
MLFIKEKRNEMFGNNSKVSGKDQIKILSEKWRSLSEAEKQMYIKKYQESAIEYTKQHEAYMNSLTKEEHQALEDKLQMRKESQKRLKSALQKLDKPVGPRSPYNFFIAERASMTFGTKANETLKKIGQEWKDLPEERKEIYRRKSEEDKKRYTNEMENWKSKMLNEGFIDILNILNKKS